MSLSLYMDVHVPLAITRALRLRGIDVLTAQEDGIETADDPDILDRATALGRTVFTQDDDFLAEATRRQRTGEFFAGIFYGHQHRVTISSCIRDLTMAAEVYDLNDMQQRVEYFPY